MKYDVRNDSKESAKEKKRGAVQNPMLRYEITIAMLSRTLIE
jgi:hypothetical protein